jgi:hypothetical protein
MTKEQKDHIDALTGKVRVKLVPKSTLTGKFVEKLTSKNPRMSAAKRRAALLRGC